MEEVISFSALDNFRDLTCVSLLAICFDGITTRFHYGKQVRIRAFARLNVTARVTFNPPLIFFLVQ